MKKLTMTIMQGIPGSWKSRYLRRLKATLVCSADSYPGLYVDGKIQVEKLGAAHAYCFKQAIDALASGTSVVIDNTNLSIAEVAPYVLLASAYGAAVVIVRVQCPQLVAYRRQKHDVPIWPHRRMARAFKEFEPLPYWNAKVRTVRTG